MNSDTIRQEAEKELAEELKTKAKAALKTQLRAVEAAKQVLAGEERKLADIQAKIDEGSL